MSPRWTDELIEPLRAAGEQGRWCRIEEARGGGWILLSDRGTGDVDWWHLPEAGGALVPLDPLEDPRLPELRQTLLRAIRAGERVSLLAWRVGSRAIFKIDGPSGTKMVKVYRKDRGVLARWEILSKRSTLRWRVPRVLSFDSDRLSLEIEFCPGTSLNRRWLAGEGLAADGPRVADLLRWLADTPLPDGFPVHSIDDEVRVIEERAPVFERTLAVPSPRVGPVITRVTAALRALPPVAPVLCHRDFHDKQVLLSGEGGALIDLDLAAAGHPALDFGNILAHLQLRALKGAELPWAEIARPIAEAGRSDRGIAESLRVWTAATLLRLTLIYARRYRRPGLIDALIDSTEASLEGTGEWREIL